MKQSTEAVSLSLDTSLSAQLESELRSLNATFGEDAVRLMTLLSSACLSVHGTQLWSARCGKLCAVNTRAGQPIQSTHLFDLLSTAVDQNVEGQSVMAIWSCYVLLPSGPLP